jgi:hypothetical protein
MQILHVAFRFFRRAFSGMLKKPYLWFDELTRTDFNQ